MRCAVGIQTSGPDLSRSRPKLDFGRGFYATTRRIQAIKWALRMGDNRGEPPAVLRWVVRFDDFDGWPKIIFADAGKSADDFWDFVRMNRQIQGPHRSNPNGYFDVVVGPASNNYVDREPVDDLDQISFHTANGVSLLLQSNLAIYTIPQRAIV